MVRKDRGESANQTDYGRAVGLAQGQVSDLELAKVRKLSHEVRAALEKRFGELPQLSEELGDAPESTAEKSGAPLDAVYHLEVRALREQLAEVQRTLAKHQDQIAKLGDARKKLLTALIQSRRPVARKKKRGASG